MNQKLNGRRSREVYNIHEIIAEFTGSRRVRHRAIHAAIRGAEGLLSREYPSIVSYYIYMKYIKFRKAVYYIYTPTIVYLDPHRAGVVVPDQRLGYRPNGHHQQRCTCKQSNFIFLPSLLLGVFSSLCARFNYRARERETRMMAYVPQPMKRHIFSLMLSPEKVLTTSTYR